MLVPVNEYRWHMKIVKANPACYDTLPIFIMLEKSHIASFNFYSMPFFTNSKYLFLLFILKQHGNYHRM